VQGHAQSKDAQPSGDRPDGTNAVELNGLTVQFPSASGAVAAIGGLSFSVKAGEFVSLVGPSGCGKTTILNVLAGLAGGHSKGEVRVLGKHPKSGNPDVAYMLARDSLLPWRTTLENACYGLELRGVPLAERRDRAGAILDRIGLAEFSGAYPKALSQGMRQRCALARTFALESDLLLMDEPFGALDAQTKLHLEDILMDLWSLNRRTVLFVTHDLSEAITLSDRVLVMSERPGRVIADVGIPLSRPRHTRSLQKDPEFHQLYAGLWSLLEQGMSYHDS